MELFLYIIKFPNICTVFIAPQLVIALADLKQNWWGLVSMLMETIGAMGLIGKLENLLSKDWQTTSMLLSIKSRGCVNNVNMNFVQQ